MAFDLTKQYKSGIKSFDLGKRTTKYVAPDRIIVPELKKVATLPAHLGGGAYNLGKPGELIRTERDYPMQSETGQWREHIIPVALGGTGGDNVKMYGKEKGEEKTKYEQEQIKRYKKGEISLNEARGNVLNKYRQLTGLSPTDEEMTVKGQIKPAIKDLPKTIARDGDFVPPKLKMIVDTGKIIAKTAKSFTDIFKDKQSTIGNFPSAYAEVAKDTVSGVFDTGIKTVRAGSQLASTPVAYLLDKITGGNLTYEDIAKTNVEIAKQTLPKESGGQDRNVVFEAGQNYLKNSGYTKTGKATATDIAVLGLLGISDLLGDPLFEAPAIARATKAVGEVLKYKKVGERVLGTTEVISKTGKTTKLPVTEIKNATRQIKDGNLKLTLTPTKEGQVVVKGYKTRFTEAPSFEKIIEPKLLGSEIKAQKIKSLGTTDVFQPPKPTNIPQLKIVGKEPVVDPEIIPYKKPTTKMTFAEKPIEKATTEKTVETDKYLYHGTQAKEITGQPKISSGKMGDAFYLTTDKQKAISFGREKNISDDIVNNKGEVVKRTLREPNAYKTSNVFEFDPKDLKIKTVENDKQFFDLIPSGEIKDANQTFRLMGYDGVFNKDTGTYAIYDTSKLKPKTPAQEVDPLIKEAKNKTLDEFVNEYTKNPEKIPTTPEYQKYLSEQENFLKLEKENYSKIQTLKDKYQNLTRENATPEQIKQEIIDTAEYSKLYAERNKILSQKTLAKAPEGVIKTHIGEKALKEQLTNVWNKAQEKTVKPTPEPKKPLGEGKTSEIKPIEKTPEFQSRVFDRLKAERPELEGDLTIERKNMEADAKKAVDLVAKDKQKAYDIAMGRETSNDVTSTAVNIALAEKALKDGNYELYSKLIRNRSLAQTRRGQELVAEKGSVTDNSTAKYVKQLISERLDNLGKNYLGDLTDNFKKKSPKERAMKKIENEVTKKEKQIKNKKLDIKTALDLLDKLTCPT